MYVSRGQKKVFYTLELELQTILSHHVGAEILTWSSEKAARPLNHWAIAPAHVVAFLKPYYSFSSSVVSDCP